MVDLRAYTTYSEGLVIRDPEMNDPELPGPGSEQDILVVCLHATWLDLANTVFVGRTCKPVLALMPLLTETAAPAQRPVRPVIRISAWKIGLDVVSQCVHG